MRVKDINGSYSFISKPIVLSADSSEYWVPVAVAGDWYNARHGEVAITLDDLATMLRNFKDGLFPPKPQQLPVDYEHLSVKKDRKPGDGIAAAWILDLEARADGAELWGKLELTDDAKEHVAKKRYKGFSPMFHPNFITHGKKEIGPTLLGGALTNYQTIPGCVLSLSMEPNSKIALASVEDIPYSERERRVRQAISDKYPPTMKDGMTDYASYPYVRFVFEDRVTFERGDKVFSIRYSFDEALGVTFDGEPYEVVITDTPVVSLSTEGHMKVKNAKGEEVDIPVESLSALTLDALSEIPAVKALRTKAEAAPAPGDKVVSMSAFEELTTNVKTLSTSLEVVKTENVTLKAQAESANVKLLDQELDALTREGKLVPASREWAKSYAQKDRAGFDAWKAAAPVVVALAQQHGSDAQRGALGGSAVVQFDALVEAEKTANPKGTWSDAILSAAKKNPDLARQRNIELSLPVGPGGVIMAG